jgi:hypothetical protein
LFARCGPGKYSADKYATRVSPAVIFHSVDCALEKPVANGQRKRDVEIVLRRKALQPAKPANEVVAECLLDFTGSETRTDFGR